MGWLAGWDGGWGAESVGSEVPAGGVGGGGGTSGRRYHYDDATYDRYTEARRKRARQIQQQNEAMIALVTTIVTSETLQ